MESKPKDTDDFLESSVLLDETQYSESFGYGYNDGLLLGKGEGRDVGLRMGFQVGDELGFYRCCVDVRNSIDRVNLGFISSCLGKSIKQLDKLVDDFPLLEPENEQIQGMRETIRLKFRVISAILRVSLKYEVYSASLKESEDLKL